MGYFLPVENLKYLKEYKYQSEDRSLLTKFVLKKFWIKFENIFPLWMAPNLVTLLGLVFIIISDFLVFYFDPDFNKPSPAVCYYIYALSMFLYQTFDACDGMHARKTQQSGPLGELFDHCIDAINTTLSVFLYASVAGIGKSWLIYLSQFASLTNFYLSTWEEYYTHKLFLSEFSGPVEGITMLIVLFVATGLFGQDTIWKLEILGFDSTFILVTIGGIILLFNVYSAKRNVDQLLKVTKQKANTTKTLAPFFMYYATVFLMLFLHPDVLTTYTTQMMFSIGSTFAFTVGRIIIGHLTKQEFPLFNFPMFTPVLQLLSIWVLTSIYSFDYEEALKLVVYCGLGLTVGIHSVFVIEIISDITDYLDIYSLSIKHQKVF